MTNCHALTASGYACKNGARYGQLCGTHYAAAERNISRIVKVSMRTVAIARCLDIRNVPLDMDSEAICEQYRIANPASHIRDAQDYRLALLNA